jgi:hypothetical protein
VGSIAIIRHAPKTFTIQGQSEGSLL